ncbi:MAG: hypothetical protein MUC97_02870 [Bernardetiaceae bacterium]|jgi:hypothetical protein|nr:hypothetical protein [Bernardetiaceae bacterium]
MKKNRNEKIMLWAVGGLLLLLAGAGYLWQKSYYDGLREVEAVLIGYEQLDARRPHYQYPVLVFAPAGGPADTLTAADPYPNQGEALPAPGSRHRIRYVPDHPGEVVFDQSPWHLGGYAMLAFALAAGLWLSQPLWRKR